MFVLPEKVVEIPGCQCLFPFLSEKVVKILRDNASKRRQTIRCMPVSLASSHGLEASAAIPVEIDVGGVTLFTLPLDSIEKF